MAETGRLPTDPQPPEVPETEVSLESLASSAPAPAPALEARFGDPRPLGQGGLGVVSALRDRLLGRTVAQKRLRAQGAPDPRRADRLWREARITAELEHPGVIPVYDAGLDAAGGPWYTMRHVQGQTLAQAIAAAQGLEGRLRLLGRLLAAAETLAYAHARGVLHCDVKPSNILVGPFGETLVIDWGMARAREGGDRSGSDYLSTNDLGGTPAYMSPERLRGAQPDAADDGWALGAILYELLTGASPARPDEGAPGWTERLVAGASLPGMPRDLLAIALRALAAAPADRYPDAGAFAHDLRTWTEGRFVHAHRYSAREALTLLARRHRTPLLLTTLALVGVAAAAAVGWSSTRAAAEEARIAAASATEARTLAERRLARLALARAETAIREERWAEAEVLAAAGLGWVEDGLARGLLWESGLRPRARLVREETIPRRCEGLSLREDGGAALCLEPDGISAWTLDPPRQRWRRDEPARQALFAGERALVETFGLSWSLLDSLGAPLRFTWRAEGAPTPGTLHVGSGGDQVAFAIDYDWHMQDLVSGAVTRRRLCADEPITGLALGDDLAVLLYTCGRHGPLVNAQGVARDLDGAEPNLLRRSPAGDRALMGRRDQTLDLLDRAGVWLGSIPGSLRDAREIAWSGDGTLAAITGDDPGVWLVAPDALQSLGRLPARRGRLAGTSQSAILLSAVEGETTRLSAWSAADRADGGLFQSEVGLADACLSPDGARVAGARADGRLQVWGADGAPRWSARWQSRVLKSCAWSPDGRLLAAAGMDDHAVRLFDGETGQERARLETPAAVRALAFAHGGAHLVVSVYTQGYAVFDVVSGQRLRLERADHEVWSLDALEDGSALVALTFSGTLLRYAAERAALQPVTKVEGGAGLAISPRLVAVGVPGEGRIVLLHPATGARLGELVTAEPVSGDLSLSPDGRWLAAGGSDGWLRVWDLQDHSLRVAVRAGAARVPVARFGGAGRWLLSAGWDGTLRLYPTAPLSWTAERWQREVFARWGLGAEELLDVAG